MGILRKRSTPTYSLDEVKRLVQSGKVMISGRPRRFIRNRTERYDLVCFIKELFEALEPCDFYKSEELEKIPGVWGDVYRPVPFREPQSGEYNNWYVKFYVDRDEESLVVVMSANYDGYPH